MNIKHLVGRAPLGRSRAGIFDRGRAPVADGTTAVPSRPSVVATLITAFVIVLLSLGGCTSGEIRTTGQAGGEFVNAVRRSDESVRAMTTTPGAVYVGSAASTVGLPGHLARNLDEWAEAAKRSGSLLEEVGRLVGKTGSAIALNSEGLARAQTTFAAIDVAARNSTDAATLKQKVSDTVSRIRSSEVVWKALVSSMWNVTCQALYNPPRTQQEYTTAVVEQASDFGVALTDDVGAEIIAHGVSAIREDETAADMAVNACGRIMRLR